MRKSNGFSARQLTNSDLHPLLCGVALQISPNISVPLRALNDYEAYFNLQNLRMKIRNLIIKIMRDFDGDNYTK